MKDIVEQRKIIDEDKVNMIVSASAGSGKTFVMIERIMKILTSKDQKIHADLDQMLILTFTNQSANEMSQRLEKKLMEQIEVEPELISQLDLIRVCDISTIHAFCQKLLKKHFYEANVCANFELLSEDKQKMMFESCVMRAITKFKQDHVQDYEEILQYFSTSRNDRDVLAAIGQISDILENQIDPKAWVETTSTFLYSDEGEKLYENYFNKKLIDFAEKNKRIFAQLIQDGGNREKLKINLRKIYDALDLIKKENNFCQNRSALFSFPRLAPYAKGEEDNFVEMAMEARKKYSERLKGLKTQMKFCDEDQSALKHRAKKIIDDLLTIYGQSEMLYARQKRTKKMLDFSDLERKVLKLLENPQICKSVCENYKYVFVDEFQDTNPVQMQILTKLEEATFMTVGDVKQSIYGFRGASPEIFQNVMKQYLDGEGGVAKTLNCNFRSNKDILNFANLVFSKIMTTNTSGVDYENEAQFVPQAEYPRTPFPSVQICLTKKVEQKNDFLKAGVYDLTQDDCENIFGQNTRNEARMMAQKILQLKSQKIYDDKLGAFRETNFSDIMILVRSRSGVDVLCEQLIECGVPIVASSKQLLCSFWEIEILICLIKLLVNGKDDVSLAAVLSSYFGGLNCDELARIREMSPDCLSYFDCVQNAMQNDDAIAKKLGEFYAFFEKFSQIFRNQNLSQALRFAVFEKEYNLYLLAQNGEGKSERVKSFCDYVEANKDTGIGELLDLLQSPNGPVAPNFSTGENDFVGINTIHSSKGLEYPIVVMFGCEHELSAGAKANRLARSSNFGLALKYVDDENMEFNSPQHQFVCEKKRAQEFAEELRLLYVAMTRAKNTLVICGACDFCDVEMIDGDHVEAKTNYLDLILGSLDESVISRIRHNQNTYVEDDQNFFCVELFEGGTSSGQEWDEKTPILSSGSKQIEKQLNDYINFKYLYNNSINLSQKNSVSSLAFDDDFYASKNLAPKKLERSEHEVEQIAANDLGTLYHLVFENIDFFKEWNLQKIEEETKRVLGDNSNLISGEKVLKIVELIKPFLGGKIYREKEFVSAISHNQIVEGGERDLLIVQGKIDLLVLGDKNYIFDYKITKIGDKNILLKKYEKQLKLYKLAVEGAIGKRIDGVFVVDVNRARLLLQNF